jgi:PEP-CTERM motif
MRVGIRAVAVAATLVACVAGRAAADLVADGGFELATPAIFGPGPVPIGDGWVVTANAISIVGAADALLLNVVPHSGSQLADLNGGFGANGLSQTLATVPGQSYMISYYIADDVGNNSLTVTFGSQTLFSGLTSLTGETSASDYQLFSFTATATSASTALTFVSQYLGPNGSVGTILDDVSVTGPSVPEPSSLALSAAGLVGGGLALRRRASRRTR